MIWYVYNYDHDKNLYIQGHCERFSEAVKLALSFNTCCDFGELTNNYNYMMEVAKNAIEGNPSSMLEFSLKLLEELLMVHLCCQLIHIMTPEGLVVCSGTGGAMNNFYRKCYVQYQHHFSLHDLISEQYEYLDNR